MHTVADLADGPMYVLSIKFSHMMFFVNIGTLQLFAAMMLFRAMTALYIPLPLFAFKEWASRLKPAS